MGHINHFGVFHGEKLTGWFPGRARQHCGGRTAGMTPYRGDSGTRGYPGYEARREERQLPDFRTSGGDSPAGDGGLAMHWRVPAPVPPWLT